MRILRTDEARFAGLPDYPFSPHYLDVEPGLRMHYVDEGPRDASPVLMLHGEPSWSYLYRHMIPLVAEAGHRVLAPDLIGFGKSDKPADVSDYSYERHMAWLSEWLKAQGLKNITLVCQNWGSLLGLRLAAEHPQLFRRIIVGNGMLPTGDTPAPAVFTLWKTFATHSPWFPVGRIVQLGTERALSKAEIAAYEAPFPSAEFKAGARAFPKLVPVSAEDPSSDANKGRPGAFWKPGKSRLLPALATATPLPGAETDICNAAFPAPMASRTSPYAVATSCRKTPRTTSPASSSTPASPKWRPEAAIS